MVEIAIANLQTLRPDRQDIEKQVNKKWNRIIAQKDDDIGRLAGLLPDLKNRDVNVFLYVNNHFEGSAPRTISRIQERLS